MGLTVMEESFPLSEEDKAEIERLIELAVTLGYIRRIVLPDGTIGYMPPFDA